jgi:enterochelin esterase-like enzyme
MKIRFTCFVLCIVAYSLSAQNYTEFQSTLSKLYTSALANDTAQLNSLWNDLVKSNRIPLIQEDSVAFLFKMDARTVAWMGDFNGWGYDSKFDNKGKRIPNTNIWIMKASFPKDARLDYKILINENDWVIDPINPHQQWSGVGGGSPNSELRMPQWQPDKITMPIPGTNTGTLKRDILFNSKSLGYQLTYSVYLPNNYQSSKKYKVIFVTDGYEYLHEQMGRMQTTMDNLISQGKIEPIVAVFIDHREPVNRSNNRRMNELAMNKKYLSFFEEEFIPTIERSFSISSKPDDRAIMGTSMGGLTSAYFAFANPGLFGMSGIQSPAFWFKPEIFTVCDNPKNPPVKIFMTTGVIHDSQEGARKMRDILEKNTCTYQYLETNQGHSWGNWRDTIDDILIYFFPAK